MVLPSDEAAAIRRRWQGYQRVLEARMAAVPVERLRELAADPIRPVRLNVARHPRTPADALGRLLFDVDSTVVWNALLHPGTPTEALIRFAGSATSSDWTLLAHHPQAPNDFRGRCDCPSWCLGSTAFRHKRG